MVKGWGGGSFSAAEDGARTWGGPLDSQLQEEPPKGWTYPIRETSASIVFPGSGDVPKNTGRCSVPKMCSSQIGMENVGLKAG